MNVYREDSSDFFYNCGMYLFNVDLAYLFTGPAFKLNFTDLETSKCAKDFIL